MTLTGSESRPPRRSPAVVEEGEVYVVDDDEAIRRGLCFLLDAGGIVCRPFSSAIEFLQVADQLPPGCIITDVRMPGVDGIELVKRLKQMSVPHLVIVVTGHGDILLAVDAMKAGAVDFIEKPFNDAVLLHAVRSALNGGGSASRHDAGKRHLAELMATLSPREREVLHGVVGGKSNKVIAADLGISPRTVEVHRANMMAKTGATGLSDLVRMALLAGI